MTLLSVDDFRVHVSTSLDDAAIQRLLDDAETTIVRFAGPVDSAVEVVAGGGSALVLSRPLESAADVTEIRERYGSTSVLTLASDDYELRGAYILDRLNTGTNRRSSWYGRVRVAYTPIDDTPSREMAQVDLVKLEMVFNPALASETVGAWTQTFSQANRSYDDWRGDILGRLRDGPSMVVPG